MLEFFRKNGVNQHAFPGRIRPISLKPLSVNYWDESRRHRERKMAEKVIADHRHRA